MAELFVWCRITFPTCQKIIRVQFIFSKLEFFFCVKKICQIEGSKQTFTIIFRESKIRTKLDFGIFFRKFVKLKRELECKQTLTIFFYFFDF